MVRFCKFEMNNPTVDTVWEAFDRVDVAGRSMAECKLCQHQIVPNRGTMCMHYRMKHCQPRDNTRQIDPLACEPLCDKPRAFAPQASKSEKLVPCALLTRALERYNNDDSETSGAEDTRSCSPESAANSRRRRRTLLMFSGVTRLLEMGGK
jgi:hypothetical protein